MLTRLIHLGCTAAFLILMSQPIWAAVDFDIDLESTEVEDNTNITFWFENSSGVGDNNILQILIGANREDPNAILINIRPDDNFMEVGEEGVRGGFISGGRFGDGTIINGQRVRVNYDLASISEWTPTMHRVRLNLSFRNKDFQGLKRIYMDARNLNGQWAGMRQVGTMTVTQPDQSSRHRPEPLSFDPFTTNSEGNNPIAQFSYWVRDRDGYEDLATASLSLTHSKNRGLFGGSSYVANYIVIRMDFTTGTYTVYDMASGYYNRTTRSIGATASVRLDGNALAKVEFIKKDPLNEDIAQIKIRFVFTNRWAGTYNVRGYATDRAGRYSGSKNMSGFTIAGGEETPIPTGFSPDDTKANYEGAPGERIPLRTGSFWYDADGADDIKFVDFKIAPNKNSNSDVFFVRVYPSENRWYASNNVLDVFDNDSDPIGSDKTISGIGRALGSEMRVVNLDRSNLAVWLPLIFEESFAGNWKIYSRAMDYNDNRGDWQQMGTLKIGWSDKRPAPARRTLEFDLGIISSQYEFRDQDGPNDIERIEFVVTKTNPGSSQRIATMMYDHRRETFTVTSNGRTNTVNRLSTRNQSQRKVGLIRVYYPQTRMVGLSGNIMYFFLCAQLTDEVLDGLYLVYARCMNTDGRWSRWILLNTYKHDRSIPRWRP